MKNKVRQSNLELLRLVSMLYIVFYHFSFHLKDALTPSAIGAVFHIGVVCFVMNSGYFGIRPTFRKFLNLAVLLAKPVFKVCDKYLPFYNK